MPLSRRAKIIIGVVVIASLAVGLPVAGIYFLNANTNAIRFTLLDNAGVMIEAYGLRIYVDPINLPGSYSSLPADLILVTHPHGDHYQASIITMLQKEGTVNVFPANMTTEIALHEGVGVNPLDELQMGIVHITAFYMYTFPVEENPATHPREANWTSYIININGFSFFHAGDSKNILEYYQLTGEINVALLPLGPGCQTMANEEVVDVLDRIQPRYFIPIHYAEETNTQWIDDYNSQVTNCQIIDLAYWQSFAFPPI
ncbi:MAG: MBL fold metallo-hydrolase [Candidatus Hodarchaeota archaeon]